MTSEARSIAVGKYFPKVITTNDFIFTQASRRLYTWRHCCINRHACNVARARGCTFAAAHLSAAGPGSWPLIQRADLGLQNFEDDEMSCVLQ